MQGERKGVGKGVAKMKTKIICSNLKRIFVLKGWTNQWTITFLV